MLHLCHTDALVVFVSHIFLFKSDSVLIVLEFNDTSNIVGRFVSSPREREKRYRRDSRGDEREGRGKRGTGTKVKKQKK